MITVDLRTLLKQYYLASAKAPQLLDLPTFTTIAVDGTGDPNTSQRFQDAVQALYTIAYTAKFSLKKQQRYDYTVMPLEALWWMDDMTQFSEDRKDEWLWTAFLVQPDFFDAAIFAEICDEILRKKPELSEIIPEVRLEPFSEGRVAQMLHIGPYSAEKPTILKLHAFIAEQGLQRRGKHHEIYLGDPRRAAPEKLKTIIRQGVE